MGTKNKILEKKRESLGLTQKEVADRLGISLNMYSLIERRGRVGKIDTWLKIKDVLHMSTREMEDAMREASI